MNKFKEAPSQEKQVEKKPRPEKPNKIARSFLNIFSGNFLSKDYVIVQLPFILFLTFIALGYIANGYYAEKSVREISHLNAELKELKSEYIISQSELMFMSNQSEVAHAVAPFGLKESTVPPKKIVVKVNNNSVTNNKN
jgi:hypothetical protein